MKLKAKILIFFNVFFTNFLNMGKFSELLTEAIPGTEQAQNVMLFLVI